MKFKVINYFGCLGEEDITAPKCKYKATRVIYKYYPSAL